MMKAILSNRSILTFLFSFPISLQLNAQFMPSRNLEIGAGGGVFIYQGDLTPERVGSFKTMKPGLQLFAGKNINNKLGWRINFSVSKLNGDESKYATPEYRRQRNFKFTSPLAELSGIVIYDIGRNNYLREKGILSPYIFSGAGIGLLNIKRDWSNLNTTVFHTESAVQAGLNVDQQKKLPKLLPFVPVGAGLRYEISDRFGVYTEATYRFIFTDYLDGFSYSANPKRGDHYSSIIAGVIYKLGKKNRLACPVVK